MSGNNNPLMYADADNTDNHIFGGLALQTSTGISAATLDGTYALHQFADDGDFMTGRSIVTFNGDGTGTYTDLVFSNGGTLDQDEPFTYTVDASGNGTFDLDGMPGMISPDASVIMFINPDDGTGSFQSTWVGIKK